MYLSTEQEAVILKSLEGGQLSPPELATFVTLATTLAQRADTRRQLNAMSERTQEQNR